MGDGFRAAPMSEIGKIYLDNAKWCCGEIMEFYRTSDGSYHKCKKCGNVK